MTRTVNHATARPRMEKPLLSSKRMLTGGLDSIIDADSWAVSTQRESVPGADAHFLSTAAFSGAPAGTGIVP